MNVDVPGAYAQRMLDRLGDADPIAVMSRTVDAVRALLGSVDDATLRAPEAAGKWSMLEVAHHLADSELVFAVRVRMIVAQDEPPLIAYDQERWAAALRYIEADPSTVLARFALLRDENLAFIATLTPPELARYGVHSERGGESVRYLVTLMAGHDLVHLDQLKRVCAQVSHPRRDR